MSRLAYLAMFVFMFSFSTIGCSEQNEVLVDTRSEAEVEQEEADYEAQMEEAESSDVTQ